MGSIRFCVLRGYIEKRGVEKEGCVDVKAIQPQTLFPIFLLQCTLGENPGNKCEVPIGNCKFTPLGYSHITCGQRRREGSFPPLPIPILIVVRCRCRKRRRRRRSPLPFCVPSGGAAHDTRCFPIPSAGFAKFEGIFHFTLRNRIVKLM